MCIRQVGRPFIGANRILYAPHVLKQGAKIGSREDIVRFRRKGVIVVLFRCLVLSGFLKESSNIHIGIRVVRVEFQSPQIGGRCIFGRNGLKIDAQVEPVIRGELVSLFCWLRNLTMFSRLSKGKKKAKAAPRKKPAAKKSTAKKTRAKAKKSSK